MSSFELFDRRWSTYRRILDHDLMEHQALTDAVATALDTWLAQRPPGAPAPRMADLGCGDLALLAPLLRRLPMASYLGLDLSPEALRRAADALGPVPYPCRWAREDLLAWATGTPAPDDDPGAGAVDVIHTAFAVHHLDDAGKRRFLEGCRRRLAPGGLLLWADVFREPGEQRDDYLRRYLARIGRLWSPLEPIEQEEVIAHMSEADFPADRAAIVADAEAAGWHWRWLWHGHHDAEALALLTPARS